MSISSDNKTATSNDWEMYIESSQCKGKAFHAVPIFHHLFVIAAARLSFKQLAYWHYACEKHNFNSKNPNKPTIQKYAFNWPFLPRTKTERLVIVLQLSPRDINAFSCRWQSKTSGRSLLPNTKAAIENIADHSYINIANNGKVWIGTPW